jgi:hypothetical protein
MITRAFPSKNTEAGFENYGMELRDYFASHAMQALISIPTLGMNAYDVYAVCAYEYADAMMEARKNGK